MESGMEPRMGRAWSPGWIACTPNRQLQGQQPAHKEGGEGGVTEGGGWHMAFRWQPMVVDNTGEGGGKGNLEDAWKQTANEGAVVDLCWPHIAVAPFGKKVRSVTGWETCIADPSMLVRGRTPIWVSNANSNHNE